MRKNPPTSSSLPSMWHLYENRECRIWNSKKSPATPQISVFQDQIDCENPRPSPALNQELVQLGRGVAVEAGKSLPGRIFPYGVMQRSF
ncbi:hypothetical protein KFK09_003484 [Dendrobium nobile]|uniref:Uncharacterized protein n=1 Tax=Dendrobium nobile TaxID=94219 RepID=A0A8T3C1F1_DENNO|nr:hypothetical protein KFK09_003484 [Dendrobium nobile]